MGELTPVYVAVDGGNHKTDVAVVDHAGSLRSWVRGPGASPQKLGAVVGARALASLITSALRLAGVAPDAPAAGGIFLAGLDLPVDLELMRAALPSSGCHWESLLGNDTYAVLRAGSDSSYGVAVVCGAGINCVGIAPDGRRTSFLSQGQLSGDWGGGLSLGREVMWASARAEDGRGPHTALAAAATAHFGRRTVAELVEDLHTARIDEGRLAELAPLVLRAAEAGDQVAAALVDRLADEVVLMGTVALRRLDLLDQPVDVVLGGSILTGGHTRLMARIRAGYADAAPTARLGVLDQPPLVGACLLVLDHRHAPPEAGRRLRAQVAAAQPTTAQPTGPR